MSIEDVESYIKSHWDNVSSDDYSSFVHKSKLKLDAKVIHVAGSNGKGGTCFYLTLIAKARLGGKCGTLFNSYFAHIHEAIWIGGTPVSDEEIVAAFEAAQSLIEKFEITGFEVLVYLAFTLFNQHGVELAIVDCGMGGSYDPTNIEGLKTALAVITNISLEHTEYLGTTLSEIASSISGIIAKEKPVLVGGGFDDGSMEALTMACAKKKTSLNHMERVYLPHLVNGTEFHFDYPPYKDIAIASFASFNVTNATMAIEASKLVPVLASFSEEEMRNALAQGSLEGRLERKGQIVFDSASNPAAIDVLRRCFPSVGRGKPVHVLFAARDNENISVMLPYLDDAASTVTLTTFNHPLARQEMGFALYTEDHEFIANPLMALMQLEMRYPEDPIVITGCQEFVSAMKVAL